jgi:hypothetical protein
MTLARASTASSIVVRDGISGLSVVCPDAERAPVSGGACGVVVRLHLRRRRTFVESESTHPRSCESGRYECDSHLVWLRGSCNAHSRVSE